MCVRAQRERARDWSESDVAVGASGVSPRHKTRVKHIARETAREGERETEREI